MKLPVKYNDYHWKERWKIREAYVKEQGGLCYYCKAPLDGEPEEKIANMKVKPKYYPENFFKYPVHLHHSHITGMTIGAVHCHCNAVLWEYDGE